MNNRIAVLVCIGGEVLACGLGIGMHDMFVVLFSGCMIGLLISIMESLKQ